MPRPPRRPKAIRPGRAVDAVAGSLARRKAAREPRVVLTDPGGHPRTLEPEDPAAEALLDAAERLLTAVQGRSEP
jgi:hypothetical protein